MNGQPHAVCVADRTNCGATDCIAPVTLIVEDPIAADLRIRIESVSEPITTVIDNTDGTYGFAPIAPKKIPVGDIHRLSKDFPSALNRRARRAQASQERRRG